MKQTHLLLWLFLCLSISTTANPKKVQQSMKLSHWLSAGPIDVRYPAFNNVGDVSNKTFQAEDLLKERYLTIEKLRPSAKEKLIWQTQQLYWQEKQPDKKGFLSKGAKQTPQMNYFVCYITPKQWMKAKLQIKSWPLTEVFLDGEIVTSSYNENLDSPGEIEKTLTLEPNTHTLLIKTLSINGRNQFNALLTPEEQWSKEDLSVSLSPKHNITIHDVLDGRKVSATSLSPNGKLVLISYSKTLPPSDKTERWSEIRDIESGKIVHTFRASQLGQIKWLPSGNRISFTRANNGNSDLYMLDMDKGSETLIAQKLNNLGNYRWAPDASYIIFSRYKDYSQEWKIRKIQGMEDRLPGFRNRSFLYMLHLESGVIQRLTYGALTTSLHDISPDSQSILFSQSRPDYNQYPYDKQNLYQMDLKSYKVDTIWKDKLFGGQAQYSPDGKKLLVQGGPSCFGKAGENIGKQPLANNYDGQLYIVDLSTHKAEPITFDFDPSISQAIWNDLDGMIYINAADKDYVNIFRYNPQTKQFTLIPTGADVASSIDIATQSPIMTYRGCSISAPYKAYLLDLKSDNYTIIDNPEKRKFENIVLGKTQDWNFKSSKGDTIIGRIYYPPNFDPNKKYPMIVNYYAGTSPVERSFGGRYPLNLYAAMGYVVYLLQPSGAIGFGQEFSAAHQNNWGITTADEIIEGTKRFISSHPFVDSNSVGCIGASYGGFMTMYLQTRTDIFAAAISHAGISSIASYWGEGYWGYSYSVNASGHSFPWNNRKLYIDQSPLFNADKIHTPMLLIHGSVDTNVPLGESIQLYQALKLLGRDVEFVQVKNQNHHILNYTQRILWNNTIFAYFAKYLKQQPKWWDNLYPDKNL